MQHVARLHGYFSKDTLVSVIRDILALPQEGRLNIKNADDGAWGNIYHRKHQILEVNCRDLRSDQALQQMMRWSSGDYMYYALTISEELEKKPLSERLFQTLFGHRDTTRSDLTRPQASGPEGYRKHLRKRLVEVLGPIADFLMAESFERAGIDPEQLSPDSAERFFQAMYAVTPGAYHDELKAVQRESPRP